MSLLHPNEDDYAFAASHAEAGWNKAVRRCMRLRALLERARKSVNNGSSLAADIDAALKGSFYDESAELPQSWAGNT